MDKKLSYNPKNIILKAFRQSQKKGNTTHLSMDHLQYFGMDGRICAFPKLYSKWMFCSNDGKWRPKIQHTINNEMLKNDKVNPAWKLQYQSHYNSAENSINLEPSVLLCHVPNERECPIVGGWRVFCVSFHPISSEHCREEYSRWEKSYNEMKNSLTKFPINLILYILQLIESGGKMLINLMYNWSKDNESFMQVFKFPFHSKHLQFSSIVRQWIITRNRSYDNKHQYQCDLHFLRTLLM